MIDHWDRLSNKECSIVRELAANDWDNITVEVPDFKQPTLANNWNRSSSLAVRLSKIYGTIIIRYEISGKKFKHTIKATQCGYKYRNQKIKPWGSGD